jgi:hypothetical protein
MRGQELRMAWSYSRLSQRQQQGRPEHENDDWDPEVHVGEDGVNAGTRHVNLLDGEDSRS